MPDLVINPFGRAKISARGITLKNNQPMRDYICAYGLNFGMKINNNGSVAVRVNHGTRFAIDVVNDGRLVTQIKVDTNSDVTIESVTLRGVTLISKEANATPRGRMNPHFMLELVTSPMLRRFDLTFGNPVWMTTLIAQNKVLTSTLNGSEICEDMQTICEKAVIRGATSIRSGSELNYDFGLWVQPVNRATRMNLDRRQQQASQPRPEIVPRATQSVVDEPVGRSEIEDDGNSIGAASLPAQQSMYFEFGDNDDERSHAERDSTESEGVKTEEDDECNAKYIINQNFPLNTVSYSLILQFDSSTSRTNQSKTIVEIFDRRAGKYQQQENNHQVDRQIG